MDKKDPIELIRHYLPGARMMQVATSKDGQPWVCTVYFVEGDDLELYWLSLPSRRHSQEIHQGSKVAIAVPIKFDKPVVGIQAEGEASEVTDPETVKRIMQKYTERHNAGHDFYGKFAAGENQHKLYKFTPRKLVLFDEVSYETGEGRKEITL